MSYSPLLISVLSIWFILFLFFVKSIVTTHKKLRQEEKTCYSKIEKVVIIDTYSSSMAINVKVKRKERSININSVINKPFEIYNSAMAEYNCY